MKLSIASSLIVYHHLPHENRNWGCNIPHSRRISTICVSLENVVTFGRSKNGVVAGTDLNAAQTAEDFPAIFLIARAFGGLRSPGGDPNESHGDSGIHPL